MIYTKKVNAEETKEKSDEGATNNPEAEEKNGEEEESGPVISNIRHLMKVISESENGRGPYLTSGIS